MSSYVLVGSQTSPFVRKLKIYLREEKIPFDNKEVNIFDKDGSDVLNKLNPINKIPVLIEDGKALWDSRVIFNHLQKKYSKKPLTIEEENTLSAIDSAIEANIIRLLSKRSNLDVDGDYMIFKRNKSRTTEILNYLLPFAKQWREDNTWNILSISLYCLLEWLEFRNLYDFKDKEELVQFRKHFEKKASVQETRPPEALK